MPVVEVSALDIEALDKSESLQVYNGLDSLVTLEVYQKLLTLDDPNPTIYDFERALQAPLLQMQLRGIKIDLQKRAKSIAILKEQISNLEYKLQALAHAIWSRPLNPKSYIQVQAFFYDWMKLPKQYSFKKGVKKVATDRDALEKLAQYMYATPVINCILGIRDLSKQLEVFEAPIDDDFRIRTSYNIAGTETGRLSSSGSFLGTGRNLQNIDAALREPFVADDGWKLCAIDLEQAESREVGWQSGILFGDWSYLDACYAGDLHTFVAKMVWPDLPWTGDPKLDRALADEPFYRGKSRRDLCKVLGHGSNYYGQPRTMALHAKLPVSITEEFQYGYFGQFPGIPGYHKYIARTLQSTATLVTPFGRTRTFFGRTRDDSTLREGIAFIPQSSTGDRLNLGLYRIWNFLGTRIRLWHQVHDAAYFLYKVEDEAEIIPKALELINIKLPPVNGHELIVPGEAKVGWNWASASNDNPHGLIKYKGKDNRSPPNDFTSSLMSLVA